VLLGDAAQGLQRGRVSVHAEDPFRHDDAAPPARAGDTHPVPQQGGADWPMYGASAAHNFSTGATPPTRLGLVWTLAGNATLGSAVVADGFAYAADVDALRPPAGPNLVIHRVAAGNGSALARDGGWTQRVLLANGIALAPSRSPAVAGARVYALFTANVTSGDQEVLAAVDASTGSTVWTFDGTVRRVRRGLATARSAGGLRLDRRRYRPPGRSCGSSPQGSDLRALLS